MATTRPTMARLALLAALLAQLQLAAASFYTVTSYFAISTSISTSSTRSYTYTSTLTLDPTLTPTATPTSSRTYTDSYYDMEIVSLFVPASALPSSDLTKTYNWLTADDPFTSGVYTEYAVAVTWTAPSSCPTPFTVVTATNVYVPGDVKPHLTAHSTATSVYKGSTTSMTYYTYFLDATQVPSSDRGNPTSGYYYTYYVANCRNPTATGDAYWGPSYTSGSGGGGGSRSGDGDGWDDYTVCSAMTGCVGLRTWVIVVATILPCIFLLGFVESYIWFRRMMLGKSALRLGTVCWCLLSLWVICITRKVEARSKEDQVLLKQYWATLGFGTRVKYWFKHGFRWRYPVELLGDPKGNNPPVVVAVPGQVMPGQQGPDGAAGGEGGEKMQGVSVQQQQPAYMPYPAQPYMQPLPGQSYPVSYPGQPGFQPPPQGYVMMPVPPQGVYQGQQQQPGFVPAPPQMGDGQQLHPPYVPSPSPVHTGTTEVPSVQPTVTPPPPGTTELPSGQAGHGEHQALPHGQQPPQQ